MGSFEDRKVLLAEEVLSDAAAPPPRAWRGSALTVGVGVAVLGVTLLAARGASSSSARHPSGSLPELIQLDGSEAVAVAAATSEEAAQPEAAEEASQEPAKVCSWLGENCTGTKCCKGPGMQCYAKDAGWATCRVDCTEGPDPSGPDGWPWSCKTLGARSPGKVPPPSQQGEDCSKSQACADPGLQCYEKAEGWASCKATCYPGMDLTDADPNPWSCKTYGVRTPGMGPWVPKLCAAPGTACATKACCSTAGHTCFDKNPYYAECAETCPDNWDCTTRGQKTPLPELKEWDIPSFIAPWVADKCTKLGDDCSKTRCCADGGHQCFGKNSTFAQCKGSCTPGPDLYDVDAKHWSCEIMGPKTPGWATEPWKERKEVSSWVDETCAGEYSSDCRESQCCSKVGNKCYEKNKDWAACSPGCVAGHRPGDKGGNWSCKELGPRRHKPWGKPSIFCFSVVQPPPNYEAGLISSQLDSGYGIFACDAFELFSTEKFTLGDGPDGPVETVTFVPAPVVESKDHTAGNAELFMHVWDAVKSVGKYQACDWTVKVDPDAVLLPERLRWHLEPHTGETGYVVNCAKPFMPEGPMMFGALEAFTRSGLDAYFNGVGSCTGNMPWKAYGEDLFMGKCLEFLGVSRINDWKIYSDGVCRGVDCTDPDAAAFHPKKDPESWHACLQETFNPRPRLTTDAPQWFKDYMSSYAR